MNRSAGKLRRAARRGALALALAAATACGGGGGGGGGGPTVPQAGITFTGANVSAPAVRLVRGPGSSGNVLELEVRADGLPAIYGLAFDLAFPASLLRFEGFADGGFLAQDGAQTSLQVAENPSGRLVVGYTRLGDVGMVSGSGALMVLRFTAIAPGSGSFTFSQNRLFDTGADEIRGPAWGGGSVQVVL